MKVLGTIINILAIMVAGGFGMTFRGKLKVEYQKILLQIVGLSAILLGFRGAWDGLLVIDDTHLEVEGTLLILFSLVIGLLLGIAFRLDVILDKLGEFFRHFMEKDEPSHSKKSKSSSDSKRPVSSKEHRDAIRMAKTAGKGKTVPSSAKASAAEPSHKDGKKKRVRLSELPTYDLDTTRSGHLFTDGFVIATLICAFNGMAFSGACDNAVRGDMKMLLIKAVIDAIMIFALVTVYGSGPIFAAVPVLAVQGIITFVGMFAAELLSDTLIRQLAFMGSLMTIGAGINLCFDKQCKVARLIPSLLISPIYGLIMIIVERLADQ